MKGSFRRHDSYQLAENRAFPAVRNFPRPFRRVADIAVDLRSIVRWDRGLLRGEALFYLVPSLGHASFEIWGTP